MKSPCSGDSWRQAEWGNQSADFTFFKEGKTALTVATETNCLKTTHTQKLHPIYKHTELPPLGARRVRGTNAQYRRLVTKEAIFHLLWLQKGCQTLRTAAMVLKRGRMWSYLFPDGFYNHMQFFQYPSKQDSCVGNLISFWWYPKQAWRKVIM